MKSFEYHQLTLEYIIGVEKVSLLFIVMESGELFLQWKFKGLTYDI